MPAQRASFPDTTQGNDQPSQRKQKANPVNREERRIVIAKSSRRRCEQNTANGKQGRCATQRKPSQ